MKRDPPLEYLKPDELELWQEANVRNNDPMQNLDELSRNIRRNGLRVPLLARGKNARGKYGVFSGQRRLFACVKAGLGIIPCFVFDRITLAQAMILSLSENMHGLPMDYEDRSSATKHLLRHFKDMDGVAAALGVTTATVKRYIGYDGLPDGIKLLIAKRKITPTAAIDIYSKFEDEEMALKVCLELSEIPATSKKERRSMAFAIKSARATDTLEEIRKAAKTSEAGTAYTVLLPGEKSRTVERIAAVRFTTKEDIAEQMLLEHIRQVENAEMRR